MGRIMLLVKGNESAAVREASKRGIPAVWETDMPGRNEARLCCSSEHALAVGRWFSENPGPPPAGGYEVGTLLFYSVREAGDEQSARNTIEDVSNILAREYGN